MGGIYIPIQMGGIFIPIQVDGISNPNQVRGIFKFQSKWAEFKYSRLCRQYCIPEIQVTVAGISTSQSDVFPPTGGIWREPGWVASQSAPCSLHGATLCCLCLVVFECSAVCVLQDPDEGAIYTTGELYTNPNDFLPSKVNCRLRKLYGQSQIGRFIYVPLSPLHNDTGLNVESCFHSPQSDENWIATFKRILHFVWYVKHGILTNILPCGSICNTNSACCWCVV